MVQIEFLIYHILQENDKVILPMFGYFFKIKKSAYFDKELNKFLPPSIIVGFQKDLSIVDVKLYEIYASKSQISIEDSTFIVNGIVDKFLVVLNQEKRLSLPGLGIIYQKEDDSFDFHQEDDLVFDHSHFGLSKVEKVNKGILESTPKEAVFPNQISGLKNSEVKKKSNKNLKYFVISFLILVISAFGVMKLGSKYFPINAKTEVAKKDTILLPVENLDSAINQENKELEEVEKINNSAIVIKDKKSEESVQTKIQKNEDEPKVESKEYQYYLITGSFSKLENANKAMEELKLVDENQPEVIFHPKKNLYLVSINVYKKEEEASKSKMDYDNFPNIWILKW